MTIDAKRLKEIREREFFFGAVDLDSFNAAVLDRSYLITALDEKDKALEEAIGLLEIVLNYTYSEYEGGGGRELIAKAEAFLRWVKVAE